MVKGLLRSQARGAPARAGVLKRTVTVRNLAIVVDGASGVGWGTAVAGALPQGNIRLLGAVAYLSFAGPTSASLADTWEGDYSIGTTATADSTLSTTDVDIVASTALAAATAEVSPRTRGVSATSVGAIIDNTAGDQEVNINLIVDDANISADDLTFTANGEIHLAYLVLGDD